MPEITIIYWRDIPAQVIVGSGRRAAKRALPERFEQAIDRAAMRSGAAETDAYLADFKKVPSGSAEGEADAIAADIAARIEGEYDQPRLKALIDNDGRA
ncbi:virulence factor [Pseudoroseicyclus sp. CXY001]|uniref:virulence factor n=1 Tax=Pseudoroseicyclus sp. CXY001 TaxID=3242492 RepID=UPI003570C5B9